MPSKALASFNYNVVDVDRLIKSHAKLHQGGRGRKALGHITRSGIVMLCASWELYVEMLLQEGGHFLGQSILLASDLPTEVQRQLSMTVKNDKNELGPIRLAGDGWKQVHISHIDSRVAGLNTPKSSNLIILFTQLLGLPDIAAAWSYGIKPLDKFVGVRGDIAHRGRHADYVTIDGLREYRDMIATYARETDSYVAGKLKVLTKSSRKPWNV